MRRRCWFTARYGFCCDFGRSRCGLVIFLVCAVDTVSELQYLFSFAWFLSLRLGSLQCCLESFEVSVEEVAVI